MTPTQHISNNDVLRAPAGATIDECRPLVNSVFATGVGLVAQLVVFPAVGVRVRIGQNLVILAAFTCISMGRTYLVRRFFNTYFHRFAAWLTRRLHG